MVTSSGEVTTLKHEIGNYSMKNTTLVVERLALGTHTSLPRAKCSEIRSSLGDNIRV